eukprot:Nitzschia sp. Nitz4//scaffold45_size130396//86008//86952//NITZ4_003462-RA/size130396-processed-gene-0.224-mRNA-1//-1//CDS//3329552437//6819//frame0
MSTETSRSLANLCTTVEDDIVCNFSTDYSFFGQSGTVQGNMTCSVDRVAEVGLIATSQNGECGCDSAIVSAADGSLEELNCLCYACPAGSVKDFGVFCDRAFVGPCHAFTCDSECGGDVSSYGATPAPTYASSNLESIVNPEDDVGVSVPAECGITEDVVSCPATSSLLYERTLVSWLATVECPMEEFQQTGSVFVSSQKDMCTCDAKVALNNEDYEDIQCHCYTCPQKSSRSYSYECNRAVVGDCTSFDCNGRCNGLSFMGTGDVTFFPTMAPTPSPTVGTTKPPSSGASAVPCSVGWALILPIFLMRWVRVA